MGHSRGAGSLTGLGGYMTSNELWHMARWRRGLLVLHYQIATVATSIWQRRHRGCFGTASALGACVTYIGIMLLAEIVLGARARLLTSAYCWARCLDDAIDSYASFAGSIGMRSYLNHKQALIWNAQNLDTLALPMFYEDVLLAHLMKSALHLDLSVQEEMKHLWEIFLYDVNRLHRFEVRSEEELIRHATDQDCAILLPSIKVVGNDEHARELISSLKGIFTRLDCFYDVLSDLRQGVVNIPREAVEAFRINLAQLKHCRTWREASAINGFLAWYTWELERLTMEWESARRALEGFAMELFSRMVHRRFTKRICYRIFLNLLNLFDELLSECRQRVQQTKTQ